jgi:hypothetical protein
VPPSISGRGKIFSHPQSIQTTFEASPDSYSVPAQGDVLGQEANHLSLSGTRRRMCGVVYAVTPQPSIASRCGAY